MNSPDLENLETKNAASHIDHPEAPLPFKVMRTPAAGSHRAMIIYAFGLFCSQTASDRRMGGQKVTKGSTILSQIYHICVCFVCQYLQKSARATKTLARTHTRKRKTHKQTGSKQREKK